MRKEEEKMDNKQIENKAKEIRKDIIEQVYRARIRSSGRLSIYCRHYGSFVF